MKKIVIFSTIVSVIALLSFNSYRSSKLNHKESLKREVIIEANARLSLAEIKKKIEDKIDFIYDSVTKDDATLTNKEVKNLIEEISTIRAYGRDVSSDAKIKLLKVVKALASKHNFKNIELLKKLENIAITSQALTA